MKCQTKYGKFDMTVVRNDQKRFFTFVSFTPLCFAFVSGFVEFDIFFLSFSGVLNMVEVDWQRITEPNMALRGDERDLFTIPTSSESWVTTLICLFLISNRFVYSNLNRSHSCSSLLRELIKGKHIYFSDISRFCMKFQKFVYFITCCYWPVPSCHRWPIRSCSRPGVIVTFFWRTPRNCGKPLYDV